MPIHPAPSPTATCLTSTASDSLFRLLARASVGKGYFVFSDNSFLDFPIGYILLFNYLISYMVIFWITRANLPSPVRLQTPWSQKHCINFFDISERNQHCQKNKRMLSKYSWEYGWTTWKKVVISNLSQLHIPLIIITIQNWTDGSRASQNYHVRAAWIGEIKIFSKEGKWFTSKCFLRVACMTYAVC